MSSAVIGTKGVPRPVRESQILDEAVAEFAARGYAGASMAAVAARAGISKPLVYQYFGSKDALFLACVHAVAGPMLDRLEDAAAREDDSVLSRVGTLAAIFASLEPRRVAWKLLFDDTMPTDGPIGDAVAGYRARIATMTVSGSQRFLRARGLADDELDASALAAVWTGLVDSLVHWWIDHPQMPAAEMTERCYRLLTAVLDVR